MSATTSDPEITEPRLSEHFATLAQEEHAARLGMWVFLASEVLLFSALFTLYSYYRVAYPLAFHQGIQQNDKLLGSANTLVLITSSLCAALAVSAMEHGRRKRSFLGLGLTIALAALFLVLKFIEYGEHFREGIFPGGQGRYLAEHGPGTAAFFNMYYLLTGAHALHVVIGICVLSFLGLSAWRHRLRNPPVAFEVGVLYWHLVDIIWIFVWPLFYLTGGHK
jgi:cytochrome c oxidase subunit 3